MSQGIQANIEKMEDYVNKSIGIITAINPHVGYEVATAIAKEAVESGKSVREVCLEQGVLTQEQLDIILHPYEMTEPGISGKELIEKNVH